MVHDQFLSEEEKKKYRQLESIDDGQSSYTIRGNVEWEFSDSDEETDEEIIPQSECKSKLLQLLSSALILVEKLPDRTSRIEELQGLLSQAQMYAVRLNQCVCLFKQETLIASCMHLQLLHHLIKLHAISHVLQPVFQNLLSASFDLRSHVIRFVELASIHHPHKQHAL